MNLMRGNRAYSNGMDSYLGSSYITGPSPAHRATAWFTKAVAHEQRTANLIAALAGDDVLILPGERAEAVAQVRKALGLPGVPEPEIVED